MTYFDPSPLSPPSYPHSGSGLPVSPADYDYGEEVVDSRGFALTDIHLAQQRSLQTYEVEADKHTSGKALDKGQIEFLVKSVLTQTEKTATPLSWGRIAALDIHYLFDSIPSQFTWFRVSVFALVVFGEQNIFLATFLGWLSSPDGRNRWLSASVKNYIDEIKFHEPIAKRITNFKQWLKAEGSDFYMLKTGLKATFVATNILFKALYDVSTAYPLLTYMNSDQPTIMMAGFLLFTLLVSQGDYVSDVQEVQRQIHNLSVEHLIYPINNELPEQIVNPDDPEEVTDLKDDEVLSNYQCAISRSVMQFPAKASCDHQFEMVEVIRLRSFRSSSSKCPCCRKAITSITFDKEAYTRISKRLDELKVVPLTA